MKKSHLHYIKDTGLKTPDDYFDNFDARLLKKMAIQNEMAKNQNPGFKVPDGYFDGFDVNLKTDKEIANPTKVKTLVFWRHPAVITGIAASLLVLFAIIFKSSPELSINQIETASIEDYLNDENLSSYDIASFLNEDELTVDHFVNTVINDESLEKYLLNNTSIEDLINE